MLISDSTARALENVAARERELLRSLPAENATLGDPYAAQIPCETPQGTYFITRDETGGRLFTRSSGLYLNAGNITDANGRGILGYTNPESALQPLHVDPIDASLGLAQNARVGSDGAVTYDRTVIEPATGGRTFQQLTIGRVAVARFPAGTRLNGDDSYQTPPPGVAPHIGVPGAGGFPPLQQLSQMDKNGGLDSGLVRLQEAYLALDALRAAGVAQGSVQKTVMDLLK
ncbi:MAG TPA: hypothetical protein VFW34_04150 [Candidatus Rubrimentiphilum sp.]|nr:hypothetical protein [Candidatus Rubrimentiphilum sp.]